MGEVVLSAFLQVLFQVIADLIRKELQSHSGLQNERTSLISDVEMIQAVIRGAEKMQLSELQKLWFIELKDVSYEATDVLDEYTYEIQRHQVIHLAPVRNSSFLSQLSIRRQIFMHDMEEKIKDIANRIAYKRKPFDLPNRCWPYSAASGNQKPPTEQLFSAPLCLW